MHPRCSSPATKRERCLASRFATRSRLLPVEAKQVSQRFEILNLAAQIRNAAHAFGGNQNHAIEKLLEQIRDLRAILLRKLRHRFQMFAQKRLVFRGELGAKLSKDGAGSHSGLPV